MNLRTNCLVDGKIVMLKREGLYCFLFLDCKRNRFYFLKGGQKLTIKEQNHHYFFETMVIYKKAMEYLLRDYRRALRNISNIVKKIGGDGQIHGNIVDIDYYNHIYLNPSDGSVKAYWAESITKRVEYSSVEALLEKERKDLYLEYKNIYLDNTSAVQIFDSKKIENNNTTLQIIGNTSMYGPSNIFRSWQYMFDVNVIREWNEEMVKKVVSDYQKNEKLMLGEE